MPTTTLETITPEIAEKYLEKNITNRNVRESWVTELSNAIKRGRFRLTHQGIGFDVKGKLIDGQHRLLAVVKAGLPVQLYVTRGLDEAVREVCDIQAKRSAGDILRLAGYNFHNATFAAMVKHVVGGMSGPARIPNDEIVRYANQYEEGILFVINNFTKKIPNVTTCPVMAPIARAYYTQDKHRLAEFCSILVTGRYKDDDADSAALALRQWLISSPSVRNGRSVIEAYRKTVRALDAFLNQEKLTRLFEAPDERFEVSCIISA